MNILLISNIVCEPYFSKSIYKYFSLLQCKPDVFYIPYNSYADEQCRHRIQESDLLILLINFDCLYPNYYLDLLSQRITKQDIIQQTTKLCHTTYTTLKSFTAIPIYWFSFENFYHPISHIQGNIYSSEIAIDKINDSLSELLIETDILINTNHLLANVGLKKAYNKRNKYRWNAPYSYEMTEQMAQEIYKQYLIGNGKTKKCLVLDCDNVLWGGILSDDGIENIRLADFGIGKAYKDFQRFIVSLYYYGVIITICSKNDEADVLEVFRCHSDMILQETHIACFQINWENKTDNIKKIANTLNIDLNSIVFVDDSLYEIEAVSAILPEITVIPYNHESIYEKLSCFSLKWKAQNEDIQKRIATYQTEQSRAIIKMQSVNNEDYIKALKMHVDIHKAQLSEFGRLAELTQRTNKCTNGNRYTVAKIKEEIAVDDCMFYVLLLSDRFSDFGIVGALAVENSTLKLFSLSCRALGRKIEECMLAFIKANHHITSIDFYSTGKNEDILVFLTSSLLQNTELK